MPRNSQSMFDEVTVGRRSMSPAKRQPVHAVPEKLHFTTPRKRGGVNYTYGNIAKLTPQQELFAQKMTQIRKDAKKKNKVEFAKVKKVNSMYLAEDETRQ